jgi:hypothetical protein
MGSDYYQFLRKIAIEALMDLCYRLAMPRATIIVDVTHPEEVTASEDWFAKWAPSLTFRSENQGCGCCVNMWNVEGPDEAFAALPLSIKGDSEWVQKGAHGPCISL